MKLKMESGEKDVSELKFFADAVLWSGEALAQEVQGRMTLDDMVPDPGNNCPELERLSVLDECARASCARGAALEGAAFFFAHAAPHAGVLVIVDGPLEAHADDLALAAHGLGLGDLRNSRTRVPDGEEKFWVYGQACCLTAPIHDLSFAPRVLCAWVSCALFQCPLGHLSRARSCQR